jgi:3'-phosphoadenosine 5'-phosphosulfate sulfotransferase (PAPS reductase)/FAD synthetase
MSQFEPQKGVVQLSVENADQILRQAADTHDFDKIFVAVSGGEDSHTAFHVALNSPEIDVDGIVYIDTGIGIPEVRDWVQNLAEKHDVTFHAINEQYRPAESHYSALCLANGAPGPPVHKQMYINLKSKPLNSFLRDIGGNVGLISGVLKDESDRRKMNISDSGIDDKSGSPETWVSPLAHWKEDTVARYREQHGLESCEVTTALEVSGDCLCAAYGDRFELIELQAWAPEVAAEIADLELELVRRAQKGQLPPEHALWAHGSTDQSEFDSDNATEQTILCGSCDRRCKFEYSGERDPITLAEKHKRSAASLLAPLYPVYCPLCDEVLEDGQAHVQAEHPDASVSTLDTRGVPIRDNADRQEESGRPQLSADYKETKYRVTQGEITTKNPHGEICLDSHQWESTEDDTERAVAKCQTCGAYQITTDYHRDHRWHPYLSAVPSPKSTRSTT